MKEAIIHISDLHITSHLDSNGENISKFDSWLNTNQEDAISQSYIESFIDIIKAKYSGVKLYLIVTGDITDKGLSLEFDVAGKFFEKILKELSIEKKDVLIVPGDHDVNWVDCLNAFEKSDKTKAAYYLHEEKFRKFSTFYQNLLNTPFLSKNQIVRTITLDDEKILIIGLNSNFKVGTKSADGFIAVDELESELESLLQGYSNYSKIAAFHHNFIANFEFSYKGQWDKNNLQDFTRVLNKFEFKIVFYGNEHTPFSEDKNQLFQSAVGAFAKKEPAPSFKVYFINSSNGLSLIPECINIINQSNHQNYPFGYWSKLTDTPNEVPEFILIRPAKEIVTNFDKLSALPEAHNIPLPENKKFIGKNLSEKLFEVVKSKKLFYSGHFHWSETSRAHNWIDVTKILNKQDDLTLANEAILEVITNNQVIGNSDFLIGLGIEGNILATNLLLKYNKPYSFLPYSYRYDEHNRYEKKLNFENNGEYQRVLIITDVVNEGRTLRKLIGKREKEFFAGVEKIYVVSLFYTGQCDPINKNILNTTHDSCDRLNDHIENRIEYYFALNLRVEKCPYGENYREKCTIYKNDLSTVHRFYDDENALNKKNAELARKIDIEKLES